MLGESVMLKIQEIREIIKLIDQSSIEKFSYEFEGAKIKLTKGNMGKVTEESTQQAQQVVEVSTDRKSQLIEREIEQNGEKEPVALSVDAATDPNLKNIVSPMVGTFYAASSPDIPAFVKKGDKITLESIVCIVEAMKLFNEIESEISGEIVEILVKDGQLVEYGQPLFLVKVD